MSSNCGASKLGKSTINYHQLSSSQKHQLSEPAVFPTKDHDSNHQSKQSSQSTSRYANRRLTTPQLVSTLTGIWDIIGQPESSGTAEISASHEILHKEDHVCFKRDQKVHTLISFCDESSTDPRSQISLSTPKSIYEDLSSLQKTLMLKSCSSIVAVSSRDMHARTRLENTHYLQHWNIYPLKIGKMETYIASRNMDNKENLCFGRDDNCSCETRNTPTELCASKNEEANITCTCGSSHDAKSNVEVFQECCNSSAQPFQQMEIGKEARVMPGNQMSCNTCEHIQLEDSTCTSFLVGDASVVNSKNADQLTYRDMSQQNFMDGCSPVESSFQHRSHGAVAVNRHAVAGALAGTVVSASLHPVDTVKTIIQANSSGQSSFYHILRRTLVERGVLGLYGGLASKIACSAPISAIYTLTYEIVKGALLPTLPKDYHSIAHCAAGGCSSIATSFVFTPSECIKQQMQVGSQYQNCWNALVGCLQRGGIASLYAGWGAVLCRNIPHSVVKFYAYESLKQFLLKSSPDNAKLDSGQTLFCGGFAGSTAALFTTPFDVVKTRVQLQALRPGRKYEGVCHALKEIFLQEGLQGLYRGLTPRLAMYISQGAIFFTSYEILKTVIFAEQELPGRSI